MTKVRSFGAGVCLLLAAIACSAGCERPTPPHIVADLNVANILAEDMAGMAEQGGGTAEKVVAEPTGFATFSGTFRLTGSPPSLPPLRVQGDDMAVCAPGGQLPPNEAVVVGPNGGIKNVLIYLDSDIPLDNPKWIHPSYAATRDAVVEFDQENCIFLSHVFAMRTTQKMKILNSDPIGHNTNIQPLRGANPFNQTIPGNGFVMHEPGGESADPFPVSCSIHPWMSAYMITRDSPYFAITDENGNFEIANLPAGVDLEFRVWQERAKFLSNVTLNGSSATWKRGKFELNFQPGENVKYDVTVSEL